MDPRRQQRNWEMLQQQLGAESRGDPPRTFSSTRTLFGIRSTVEQQLDEYVAREEARKAEERARERGKRGASSDGSHAVEAQGESGIAKNREGNDGNRSDCED